MPADARWVVLVLLLSAAASASETYGSFLGRAVDWDGRPISGVRVEVRGGVPERITTVITRDDGWYFFHLPAGRYEVEFTSPEGRILREEIAFFPDGLTRRDHTPCGVDDLCCLRTTTQVLDVGTPAGRLETEAFVPRNARASPRPPSRPLVPPRLDP